MSSDYIRMEFTDEELFNLNGLMINFDNFINNLIQDINNKRK